MSWKSLYLFGLVGLFFLACGEPPPPSAPKNVTTNIDLNVEGQIVLRWDKNPEPDVVQYRVYRDGDKAGTFQLKVYEGSEIQFIDSNVLEGGRYDIPFFYSVTAVDLRGKESTKSNPIEARTKNQNPPSAPIGLTVKGVNLDEDPSSARMALSWTPNKELDILGYYVFRSDQPGPISAARLEDAVSPLVQHKKTGTIVWEDTKAQVGKNFGYVVVAVDFDKAASTVLSGQRRDDIILPQIVLTSPANQADGVNTKVDFSWQAVENAKGYVVVLQRQKFGGEVWRSSVTTGTQASYNGTALNSGVTYYWFVFAYSKTPSANTEDGNSVSPRWQFKTQ